MALMDLQRFNRFTNSLAVHRLLLISALLLIPACYLLSQAWLDPGINFLLPSLRATWALHPIQEILSWQGKPVSRDVAFHTDFDLDSLAGQNKRVITAFREAEVILNDRVLYNTSPGRSWKMPIAVDMSSGLKSGRNQLEVRVHNEDSVPALLVEEPRAVRTLGLWQAALAPEY